MTAMRETWFCLCKDKDGHAVLRPASRERCVRCGMTAPWLTDEKERRY